MSKTTRWRLPYAAALFRSLVHVGRGCGADCRRLAPRPTHLQIVQIKTTVTLSPSKCRAIPNDPISILRGTFEERPSQGASVTDPIKKSFKKIQSCYLTMQSHCVRYGVLHSGV